MKVAISWSGGMESSLTCHKMLAEGHDVAFLVAFVSDKWPLFCHPLSIMHLQSKALGIPLLKVRVKEPYKESYREAISRLIEKEAVEGIVTGDLYVYDEAIGRWMDKVCEGLDISVIMPYWGEDSFKVLNEEMSAGFRSIFTCVKEPWFNEDWLGRELNATSAKEVEALAKEFGIDPCGERGEYHSMVIDGPIFKEAIEIWKFSKEKEGNRLFIKIKEASLKPKNR